MKSSYTIVFFGTSEFGAIILKKLVQAGIIPVLVVSTPDRPAGRGYAITSSPVKIVAQKHGIPVEEKLEGIRPDLIVLAAYGRIIPKAILDIPVHGALNVHPSLLPKHRGPSPIQTTILNGDEETGVTLILMDEQIDHGPILTNDKLQITNDKITYPQLHNQLAELGAKLLIDTIPLWIEGKIKPVPQDDSKATYTKIIKKEDGRIDWTKPARYIERQIRALHPWPGTYAKFEIRNSKSETIPKILKILNASVFFQKEKSTKHVGETFLAPEGKLAVQTGKGVLLIEELQLEGGKPMSSRDFLLGHKYISGIALQ